MAAVVGAPASLRGAVAGARPRSGYEVGVLAAWEEAPLVKKTGCSVETRRQAAEAKTRRVTWQPVKSPRTFCRDFRDGGFYQMTFFLSLSGGRAENCIFVQQKYTTLLHQFPFLILLSVFHTRLFTATETVAGRRNAEQWCIKLPPHHATPRHATALPTSPPGAEGRALSLLADGFLIPVSRNGQPTYARASLPAGEI